MKRIFLLIMIFMLLSAAVASSHFSAKASHDDVVVKTVVLPVYDSDRVTFLYYAVYAKYEWTAPPTSCKTDGITINWDSKLLTYVSDSFYYKPSYKSVDGSFGTQDCANAATAPDAIAQGGVGLTFALSDADDSLPKGTAFIRLAKKNDSSSAGSRTQVSSAYAHTLDDAAAESLMVSLSGKGTVFECRSDYWSNTDSADIFIR